MSTKSLSQKPAGGTPNGVGMIGRAKHQIFALAGAVTRACLAKELKCKDAILDGEIVALGGAGNPAFCELMKRQCQAVYYAFDILWLNGRDACDLPLVERKKFSAESSRESPVRLAALVTWTGALKLFELVKKGDLEGLVVKRKDAK